jgi:hypothetical protein
MVKKDFVFVAVVFGFAKTGHGWQKILMRNNN